MQVSSTNADIRFNVNSDCPEVKYHSQGKEPLTVANPSRAVHQQAIDCVSSALDGLLVANKSDFKELFKGASVWDVKIMYGSSLN